MLKKPDVLVPPFTLLFFFIFLGVKSLLGDGRPVKCEEKKGNSFQLVGYFICLLPVLALSCIKQVQLIQFHPRKGSKIHDLS